MKTQEKESVVLLDNEKIYKAICRMAKKITEQNYDLERLILAGIPTGGKILARRIATQIVEIAGVAPTLGIVDITMHRDDLSTRTRISILELMELPVDLDGRPLVLVDDVVCTGRTCRAAIDAITSFGRPSRIQLAALIDRDHRELPIQADFIGEKVVTAVTDKIKVNLEEINHLHDSVKLLHR